MNNLTFEVHSALRALLRSQRITFSGDSKARIAARQLNRALLAPALSPNAPWAERQQALLGAQQAAQYFRENVLQGVSKQDDTFALRITQHTKLGDNESIKNVKPAPSLDEIVNTRGAAVRPDENGANSVRRRRRQSDSLLAAS